MIIPLNRLDDHVLNIYLKVPPYFVGGDSAHESLVCDANILETGRHGIIVIVVLV